MTGHLDELDAPELVDELTQREKVRPDVLRDGVSLTRALSIRAIDALGFEVEVVVPLGGVDVDVPIVLED